MKNEQQTTDRTDAPFIVVEGVDGAGTTTIVTSLVAHFRRQRQAVHGTCEPTAGPIGALIRQALTRRFVVPSLVGSRSPGWVTMALLFAADRQDHLETEILPLLQEGVTVICDRYDLSSLAYQTATATPAAEAMGTPCSPPTTGETGTPAAGEVLEWIRMLNFHARRPDLTIVVDVRPEVAAQRRRTRGGRSELFDDEDLQRRLCNAYGRAEALAPLDRIVHIDGNQSANEVLANALATIEQFATARRTARLHQIDGA